MTRLLARWRVFLGFVFAAIVLWLATPSPRSLAIGAAIAIVGESIRLWAAGHLEKSTEVTQSGPYRYTRHPLYLGFFLAFWATPEMTAGHLLLAAGVSVYMLIAIRYEERDLIDLFGKDYEDYREQAGMLTPRIRRRNRSPAA